MNAKTENPSSTLDTVKLFLSTLILIGGIVGFYYLADTQALWLRLLELLVVIGIAVFIALQTEIGQTFKHFIFETRMEVRKVVWPTRAETMQTTLVIFIVVLITALFLWAVDSILFLLVRYLTGQG